MLLQKLRAYYVNHDTTDWAEADFVYNFFTPLDILACSKLFWPDLVEFRGMTFHRMAMEDEKDEQRVEDALAGGQGDPGKLRDIEASFNIVEISDLSAKSGMGSEELDWELAQVLGKMWRARLRDAYPAREFVVDVIRDVGDGAPAVTFHEKRE